MPHLRMKLTAAFSLKRTPPSANRSYHNMGQVTETPGSFDTAPAYSASPSPTGRETSLTDNMNCNHTRMETSAVSRIVLRWRTKVFPAIACKHTPISGTPPALFSVNTTGRYIGPAILASGLVAAAPLHTVSPPAGAFTSTTDDNIDLSRARSALCILSALGDGVAGVPWLKGAAELALEIVNILDVSHLKTG